MRIFTVFALCGSLAFCGMAEASSPFKVSRKAGSNHDAIKRAMERVPGNVDNWKPGTVKAYGWNGRTWLLEDTYTFTYDHAGNTVKEVIVDYDDEMAVTDYTYDEHNMMTGKETAVSADGENFENNSRTAREYDPILTNVITQNNEWKWMDDDWQLVGNNYRRIITRDDKGNITRVVIATLYQGYYDPIQRLEITYGDDGKATTISQMLLSYDGYDFFWVLDGTYRDIEWEITDGQIVSNENLFLGKNRIKSAVYESDDVSFTINVAYLDGCEGYECVMEMEEDGETIKGIAEYVGDEYEGYTLTTTTIYPDGTTESETEKVRYNEWGHLTLSYYEWTDGTYTEVEENLVGTVEYDEDGFPLSYTVTEDYLNDYTGQYVTENTFRAEYSDYVDVTAGVGAVSADADGPVEYYSLQGVRLAAPAKGTLCIRRQGSRSEKIVY